MTPASLSCRCAALRPSVSHTGLQAILCLVMPVFAACSVGQEASRVDLPVATDGAGLEAVSTDLGYEVVISSASVAVDDLQFTIAGEVHASRWRRLIDTVIPSAHAHPGHFQAGEVTGELLGHFLLRFAPDEVHEVGTATLVEGKYHGVNLTLSRANVEDATEAESLFAHTALLVGLASKDGSDIDFEVVLDSPEGRKLVGIPFEEAVTGPAHETLAFRLLMRDPVERDTLFDGIDFSALDADADGHVLIDPNPAGDANLAAYNLIRRAFQTHDHFIVQCQD